MSGLGEEDLVGVRDRHLSPRDLEILTAIGEGRPLSQRVLAQRLGVALGLTNLLLKRLARKGSIKIVEFPKKPAARKRLRYLLTPKGIAEKTWDLVHDRPDEDVVKKHVTEWHERLAKQSTPGVP